MNQTTNSVREPENWPSAFTKHLEAGELEELLALYDEHAQMLAPPRGELVGGHRAIRSVVGGLIQCHARLQSHVVRCVTTGDLAILYTDFNGSLTTPSGEPREIRQHAIEVLRRQPDGTWKLVFGDPVGRGGI